MRETELPFSQLNRNLYNEIPGQQYLVVKCAFRLKNSDKWVSEYYRKRNRTAFSHRLKNVA